jgi:hypothetical protein
LIPDTPAEIGTNKYSQDKERLVSNTAAGITLQKAISYEEHIEQQQSQIFPQAKRHVYMSFVRNQGGWHCRFHQDDLPKTPISRGFVFRGAEKIYEAAQRGDGLIDMECRDALDEAVALGRGGIWLRLTEDQYSTLLMSSPSNPTKARRPSP